MYEHIQEHFADTISVKHEVKVDSVALSADGQVLLHSCTATGACDKIVTPFMVRVAAPSFCGCTAVQPMPAQCCCMTLVLLHYALARHASGIAFVNMMRHVCISQPGGAEVVQVGADGASSDVLECIEQLNGQARCHRLPEKPRNTRIYKTIRMPLPAGNPDWINTASYSERNEAGRVLECLPNKESAMPCFLD